VLFEQAIFRGWRVTDLEGESFVNFAATVVVQSIAGFGHRRRGRAEQTGFSAAYLDPRAGAEFVVYGAGESIGGQFVNHAVAIIVNPVANFL